VPRRSGDARDLVMNVESIRIEPADGGSNTKGESSHE